MGGQRILDMAGTDFAKRVEEDVSLVTRHLEEKLERRGSRTHRLEPAAGAYPSKRSGA